MPYRYAHWFILALAPLILLAFWPTYWSVLPAASWQYHFHGATATAWLALLLMQSWTIHNGHRARHRSMGLISLGLFPLFLAGGIGILFGMARKAVAGSEFHVLYAARLVWLDLASVVIMAIFFHQALKHRRAVQLHSAYMLATTIALLPPIFGRLSAIPLGVTGPGTFDRMYPGFIVGQIIAAAIAFSIGWGRGAGGRPWMIAGVLSLAGGAAFATIGGMRWWQDFFPALASISSTPFMATAFLLGGAIAWSGWQAGKRPTSTAALTA